ncbi:reverse transcriptase, partial [Triplophysa rosa]
FDLIFRNNPSSASIQALPVTTGSNTSPASIPDLPGPTGSNTSPASIPDLPVTSARNLGVIFDGQLSFNDHIAKTTRSCRYALFNIRKVRPYLTEHAAQLLVQTLVISRLDYCNALLAGLPAKAIKPLQLVQNAAARLIFQQPKRAHVTPLSISLHWLPVEARIRFKSLMLAYRTITGYAPAYFHTLLHSIKNPAFSKPAASWEGHGLAPETRPLEPPRLAPGWDEEILYGDADFIFQQDLAPAHSAKATSTWFKDHGIPVLNWPANSPDLNPTENLWGIVKRKVRYARPNNAEELKATIRATWPLITPEQCHRLIDSMPRRIAAVIQAKGAPTKY